MGPIFDAYVIPSCVLCLSFFSSLSWTFISRISRMFLGHSHSSHAFGRSFVCIVHQGILSLGFDFVSIIRYSYRHFTFIQRRPSYLPFTPPHCTVGFDMTVVSGWNPPRLFLFAFCLSLELGWGVFLRLSLIPLIVA